MSDTETRLNELDKQEMWDISRILMPTITDEEFDALWAEFVELKRKHELKQCLA